MKKPELLLPAGSLSRLKTAFLYGADAVYCGTPTMSLRAKSKFTIEEVKEGVDLANNLGKKVYLTLNLFAHNKDLERLPEFVTTLREIKPHGVIVADPAIFMYLRENAPELNDELDKEFTKLESIKKKKPKEREYYVKGADLIAEIKKYQESKQKDAENRGVPLEERKRNNI